jgi:flagellar assembly protein FliH
MILRDATVSELRRTLSSGRLEPAAMPHVSDTREAALARHPESRDATPEESVAQLVLGDAAPAVAPTWHEPRLTFEQVVAWLAVQDGEMRTACASLLADELTQVHEAAKAEGHSLGRREGRKQAEQELEQSLATLQQVTTEAEQAFAREQDKLAEGCVEVIAEAFTKLAGTILATPAAIHAVVGEVLARVREGRELTVRVSAQDLALLEAHEPALRASLAGRSVTFAADPRIDVGGCIVESTLGSLDGRLEVQLRALYETLKAAKSPSTEAA